MSWIPWEETWEEEARETDEETWRQLKKIYWSLQIELWKEWDRFMPSWRVLTLFFNLKRLFHLLLRFGILHDVWSFKLHVFLLHHNYIVSFFFRSLTFFAFLSDVFLYGCIREITSMHPTSKRAHIETISSSSMRA